MLTYRKEERECDRRWLLSLGTDTYRKFYTLSFNQESSKQILLLTACPYLLVFKGLRLTDIQHLALINILIWLSFITLKQGFTLIE